MIDKYIVELKKLSINREKTKIKSFLQQIPIDKKGIVFEEYLKELYIGNGWLATRNGSKGDVGADILLFHPKTPDTISIIVQAKNQARPLSYDDTRIELIKFEEKSKVKYKCNSYILVSIEGYVKDAKKLDEFNMRLENWNYVEGLIDKYNIKRKNAEPEIELLAHNKKAYDNSKELFRHSKKVAVVQATGTGKSYIVIKFLSDFIDKKCLVVAPSKYILKQLKSKFMWSFQNAKLMTYAKLARYSESEIESFKFDLIVLDEFHRCGAKEWGKGVKLLINNNHASLLLGTTATPIRYLDGNKDMSDELFDGNVSTDLSLATAIAKNILPMPTYVTALYTIEGELKKLDEKISSSDDPDKDRLILELLEYKKSWEKSKGIPTILNNYIKKDDNKFIVFCENKKHLSNMEWLVKKWFIEARPDMRVREYRVVSGDKQSDNELHNFKLAGNKNETHLLFAIDMLNEGLHIDDISGVILLRNTTSPRIFYQQIGRAIKAGNIAKKPLIFDFVNNFNNISAEGFITDLNKSKEIERQKRNKLGLGETSPEFTIYDETKEELQFFNDIELRLKNAWEYRYEQLKEFYRANGHCRVKRNYESKQLAAWIVVQRQFYKKGLLENERIEKLNTLNFEWQPNLEQWLLCFKMLESYFEEFGTTNPPRDYYVENINLGGWSNRMRKRYKQGKLSKEQIDLLEGIGFKWEVRLNNWEQNYEQLVEFKKENGHCDVSRTFHKDKLKLAIWVAHQRGYYKRGKLSDERIRRLNEIGFQFVMPDIKRREPNKWDAMYNQLVEFKNENGHFKVSYNDELKLARWVDKQREAYKKGRLLDERMKKLNEIEFDFK